MTDEHTSFESCLDPDYVDVQLSNWEPLFTTPDTAKNPVQVYRTLTDSYVYCYPWIIQIANKTYDCPTEVMRIDAGTPWKTRDFQHNTQRIGVNLTSNMHHIEDIVTNVPDEIFPRNSEALNSALMAKRLKGLAKANADIKLDMASKVQFTNHSWTLAIIGSLTGAIGLGAAYYVIVVYIWPMYFIRRQHSTVRYTRSCRSTEGVDGPDSIFLNVAKASTTLARVQRVYEDVRQIAHPKVPPASEAEAPRSTKK